MKTSTKHILAIAVSFIYMVAIYFFVGICYSINDDRFMGELLSGAITGNIESHLVYVNYLLSLPLSLLYRISTSMPWFGIMLLFFHTLSCYFILDSFYSKIKTKSGILFCTLLVGILFLSQLYLVSQISYTITAAFMAVSGCVCLLLNENKKVGYSYFFVLELLAYLLRDKGMLMILPLGIAVFCGILLADTKISFKNFKDKAIIFSKVLGIVISILIIGFLGNTLGYHNETWQTYQSYNEARTTLYDFTGFPPYEEVSNILDKYDVKETDYKAYSEYTILDYKLSQECIIELAQYAENNMTSPTLGTLLESYKIKTIWDPYWKTNYLMLTAWISTIIFLLLSGNYSGMISAFFLMGARTVIWLYLLYSGRFPHRISMPLLACEILLLITLAFYFYTKKSEYKKWQNLSFIVLFIFVSLVGLWSFKLQLNDLKINNDNQSAYMQTFRQVLDYCNENTDNTYILDTLSFTGYNAEALDGSIYGTRNCVMSATWFSNSPSMAKKNLSYLGNCENGFYYILRSTSDESDDELNNSTVKYLASESFSTPQMVDSIHCEFGITYSVIYFDKPLNLYMNP